MGDQLIVQFQFQNGAIKREAANTQAAFLHSFNSKMVRLKGFRTIPSSAGLSEFQFQNGAIKSACSSIFNICI